MTNAEEPEVQRLEALIRELPQIAGDQNGSLTALLHQDAMGIAYAGLTGAITFFNARFQRLVGFAADEMGNMPLEEVVLADASREEVAAFRARLERLRQEREPFTLERSFRKPQGDRAVAKIHVSLATDANGDASHFLVVAQDVTEGRLFDTALSHTADALYILDREGCIRFANRTLLSRWNKTLPEAVGKSLRDIGYPEDLAERVQAQIGTVFETRQPLRDDTPLRSFTRSTRHYEYILVPVLAADGSVEAVAGSTRDVTDRNDAVQQLLSANAELELARERLAQVFEAERMKWRELFLQTPAAVVLFHGPEHVVEAVNASFSRLVGRPAESIVGRPARESVWEIEAQGFLERMDEAYRTGVPFSGDETLVRVDSNGDGLTEDVYLTFICQATRDMNGAIDGLMGHAQVVTRAVLARSRAEEGERQMRRLAESIPQLVWSCLPDGGCDYLSSQWVAYTGVPAARQLGDKWLAQSVHPEDRERVAKSWTTAVRDLTTYDAEFRIRRHDGVYRWFQSRATPVRDDAGRVEKWFGTCTDIDDRKHGEREMLAKQKLESLGLLAGGIAHDFNNLLVGVLGNAELIRESLPVDHALQPLVRNVASAGERAAHLTRQMLAYAGKGRFYVEHCELPELVRSTVTLLQGALPKGVRVALELQEDTPLIECDCSQIQGVLMNLVMNAGEAVPEGSAGVVTVRSRFNRLDRNWIQTRRFASGPAPQQGDFAVVEVQDNGSGMDDQTIAKIFDPFFTTKFTGRGLGLAAAQGVMRSLGGAIELESEVGRGTTFRLLFPALSGRPERKEAPALPAKADENPAPVLVLVVEDEEIVRETARALLESLRYQTLFAVDGESGMELYRQRASEISLVLLDLSLPGMSGRDVLRELRGLNPALPVLIFSGYSEEHVHQEFAGLKISGFLQKPFSVQKLEQALRLLLKPNG